MIPSGCCSEGDLQITSAVPSILIVSQNAKTASTNKELIMRLGVNAVRNWRAHLAGTWEHHSQKHDGIWKKNNER